MIFGDPIQEQKMSDWMDSRIWRYLSLKNVVERRWVLFESDRIEKRCSQAAVMEILRKDRCGQWANSVEVIRHGFSSKRNRFDEGQQMCVNEWSRSQKSAI